MPRVENAHAGRTKKELDGLRARIAQLERCLAEESVYRRGVETSGEGVQIIGRDRRIVYVNDAFAAMLGYEPSEMIGQSVLLIIFEEDLAFHAERMRMREAGASERFEHRLRRKDGTPLWAIISASPLTDGEGNYLGAFAFIINISKRKAAEQALLESERLNRTIIDLSPDCIKILDGQRRLAFISQGGIKGLGLDDDQAVIGRHYIDFWGNADKDKVRQAIDEASKGGVGRFTGYCPTAGGLPKWWDVCAVGLEDNPKRRYLVISRDITERKIIEDTMLFLVKSGEEAHGEAFFASLARYLGLTLDMDFVCIDILEGDCKSARTLAVFHDGRFEDNVTYALKDTPCGDVAEDSICCIAEGVCNHYPNDQVLQDLNAESYFGTVLANARGEPIGLIAVIGRRKAQDMELIESVVKIVSMRAAGELESLIAQEELLAAKEAADSANKTKSEFLASMSHDIRTPLNGVIGMLQLLETTGLNAEQGEYARSALDSARRLTTLLADILDLSRVESGKLAIHETNFCLEDIRRSIIELFGLQARDKGIELDFTIDPALPTWLTGDEARLRQILVNLAGNAVKFTSQGFVRITAAPAPDVSSSRRVSFTVVDTGCGIPEHQIDRIFEPFVQAEGSPAVAAGGTGLGLAIVKRIVALMGGDVTIASEFGKGTTAHVVLPLTPVQEAEQSPGWDAGLEPRSALNILLAEDERINQLVIGRMLEKAGHSVDVAANGLEALKMLSLKGYDCVLMDVQMPFIDGVEATRALRRSSEYGPRSRTPVVALTANAMAGDRERFLEAGMDDYLSKPVDMADLTRVLARLSARRQGGR